MKSAKLLKLLGALALAVLTLGHASAQEYELDVTMGEHGIPSEFFYADERMSFRITPDIKQSDGGGWVAYRATIELVVVDEEFHPSTGKSECVMIHTLGKQIPPHGCVRPTHSDWNVWPVELKNPRHVIIRDFPIRGMFHPNNATCVPYITHRTSLPQQTERTYWSISEFTDEMEIAKAFDLFLQSDECVRRLKKVRVAESQPPSAQEEKIVSIEENTLREEDILLLTNRRLLQCAFDPVCEGKINAGVDRCKKTVEGNYVESCIRAIEVSP